MIIAINGYIGSGKDTLGKMIQSAGQQVDDTNIGHPTWEIKKFAQKLKQIASILTGIPEHYFEDQEFKNKTMDKEWWRWHLYRTDTSRPMLIDHYCSMEEVQGAANLLSFPSEISLHKTTVREFLQWLGSEAIRNNIHKNAWVNALFADYESLADNWIITDCRFPNEAQAVKDRGGIVIRINRGLALTEEQRYKLHPSETSLDNWKFDMVVDNNGTMEELQQITKGILAKITVL